MYTLTTNDALKVLNTFKGEGEKTREVINFQQYSVIDVSKGIALCSFNMDPTMQCQISAVDVILTDGELIFKGWGRELRIKVVG